MKKIKFDGQQTAIPTSWDDVKLGDYEKWSANNKPTDERGYIRHIAALCKIDADKLQNEQKGVFGKIEKLTEFIFAPDFEPSQSVVIDGKQYTVAASDELTLGEWIDIDSVQKSESETSLSEILAIVCRPVGELYDHKESAMRAQLFREQSCVKMMPLVSFFLIRKQRYNEILSHSSTVAAAANQFLRDTKIFAANGDGIKRLPIWQRIRFSFLMKSLQKELSRFSGSYSI